LLVAEIPSPADDQDASSGHILVLNKFPVIPRHFILATKRFRNQTDLLEKEDLEATFACIQAWKNQDSHDDEDEAKKRLFAFFNSGDESGASQPHRHLQFLPVEDMREQQDDKDPKWIPLIDRVATADVVTESGLRTLPSLPFRHFALPLPLAPSLETLYEAYLSLYRAAVQVSSSTWDPAEKAEKLAQTAGPAAISYNFAMTESAMMICPRRSETAYLNNKNNNNDDNDTNTGKISLNGTILAGTLMVKQESEWDELRNEPEKINFLLADVGF
jgi:ATP adenylyltransferase